VDREALHLQVCGQVTSSMVWTTPELEVSEPTDNSSHPVSLEGLLRRNIGSTAHSDDIPVCLPLTCHECNGCGNTGNTILTGWVLPETIFQVSVLKPCRLQLSCPFSIGDAPVLSLRGGTYR
jgi:hypothetical protein